MNITRKDIERFEQSYTPVTESGCWLWAASKDDRDYGRIRLGGRQLKAHRASWLIHHGPIPTGAWVLHKCHTVGCVRPDHLYLGDHQDNTADMVRQGRQSATVKAAMQRPEVRARLVAAIRTAVQRPEVRADRSATQKRRYENPDERAKTAATTRAYWAKRKQQQLEETKDVT